MHQDKGINEGSRNPWLSGNFAPIEHELPLIPCSYTGAIPVEFAGGEYIRNGGNPISNQDPNGDAHWFDGDGMLSGVLFRRLENSGNIQPEFTNRFVLTDVYLSAESSPRLTRPVLPSIATLVNPQESLFGNITCLSRTFALILRSHLAGSRKAIKKISVANTALYFHDGRSLATCESGPPMRIKLPELATVGWYSGKTAEGEADHTLDKGPVFGGWGPLGWFREWVTAHPKVDPNTKELILYHNTFIPPFLNYSVILPSHPTMNSDRSSDSPGMLNRPVPGITSAKMMHDFGVSESYTVIMDLPLSLDLLNLVKNRPVIDYNAKSRSRFGVFPRYRPQDIQWFETNACCIFHTANTWQTDQRESSNSEINTVNMLCCRMTSAFLIYGAGNMAAPAFTYDVPSELQEEEQCRLYYYGFQLPKDKSKGTIINQWALTAIPMEFPIVRGDMFMSAARYVYGCYVGGTTFGATLGSAFKIHSLIKVDVKSLIANGTDNPPTPIKGCVDVRDINAIFTSGDPQDPIKIFKLPVGHCTQEPRFVPRANGMSEDDGWLVTYVFDETTQLLANGEPKENAHSELWIIDAKSMQNVVAKICLPQRVPYGFHGNWISEDEIAEQRPVEKIRSLPRSDSKKCNGR